MHILIADDHELFRDGLRRVLADLGPDTVVLEAGSYAAALTAVRAARHLDAVLVDLAMPGLADSGGWRAGITALKAALPAVPLVVLSASDSRALVVEAVGLGVAGFIPKTSSANVMLSALRLVVSGGVYLPPEVLTAPQGTSEAAAPAALSDNHSDPAAEVPLTPRQREVLRLLGQGKSNKEIARVLDLSEGTVKLHVTAILKALKVSNRTSAVVAASRLGLSH